MRGQQILRVQVKKRRSKKEEAKERINPTNKEAGKKNKQPRRKEANKTSKKQPNKTSAKYGRGRIDSNSREGRT